MAIEGRLFEQIQLDNGLTIYFHDQSRPIVGNRCQLRLHISVPVLVKEQYFASFPDPRRAFEEFTAACGSTILLTLEKVRNFIDENKVGELMKLMTQEFLRSNQAYISSPNFPEKFTLKQYAEWKKAEGHRKNRIDGLRRMVS